MARLDDIAIAQTLCDYFLDKRVYGQGIDTSTDEGALLYQKGAITSRTLALQNHVAGRINQVEYWQHIGQKNRREPAGSGLWCDGSAGMVISLLSTRDDFKSKLEVIKQGQSNTSWSLVGVSKPAGTRSLSIWRTTKRAVFCY